MSSEYIGKREDEKETVMGKRIKTDQEKRVNETKQLPAIQGRKYGLPAASSQPKDKEENERELELNAK